MKRRVKQARVHCLMIAAAAAICDMAAQGLVGQQQDPPPTQPYDLETPEQLQRLVAPIALYPDSLVAFIL